jgi:hypothetical protein
LEEEKEGRERGEGVGKSEGNVKRRKRGRMMMGREGGEKGKRGWEDSGRVSRKKM